MMHPNRDKLIQWNISFPLRTSRRSKVYIEIPHLRSLRRDLEPLLKTQEMVSWSGLESGIRIIPSRVLCAMYSCQSSNTSNIFFPARIGENQ